MHLHINVPQIPKKQFVLQNRYLCETFSGEVELNDDTFATTEGTLITDKQTDKTLMFTRYYYNDMLGGVCESYVFGESFDVDTFIDTFDNKIRFYGKPVVINDSRIHRYILGPDSWTFLTPLVTEN